MSEVISRRIKQLENQNTKFKKLLESTLQITSEQKVSEQQLRYESEFLKKAVTDLENQKKQLEEELRLFQTQNFISEDFPSVQILQKENVDIQNKLLTTINDLQRESTEIGQLKSEDKQLKQAIAHLEEEKTKLMDEIMLVKKANEENNLLACENLKLKQELALLEQEALGKNDSLKNWSGQDLIKQLASIEEMKENLQNQLTASTNSSTDLLNSSTEHTVLELKISGLEKQKQNLLKELKAGLLKSASEVSKLYRDTSDGQLRNLLNELDIHKAILMINVSNIKEMKSFEEKDKDEKENTENKSYTPANNSNCVEYCHLTATMENMEKNPKEETLKQQDPDLSYDIQQDLMNSLHKEIDIKAFLGSKEKDILGSPPPSKYDSEHTSALSFPSNSSEVIQEVIDIRDSNKNLDDNLDSLLRQQLSLDQETHELPTVSEEDEVQNELTVEQNQLKEEVNRLERERQLLLDQLQRVRSWEDQNVFHAAEESFEHLPRVLDDATNQMYANNEQLLEQRIRELEEDNERIRRDLNSLIEETQSDNEDLEILSTGERLIRENKGSLGDHMEE